MSEPALRYQRNPRPAYEADGRMIAPPTVGDLRALGETTAEIFCDAADCRHSEVVPLEPFPADLPFPDIALRLRCSRCGSKSVTAQRDMVAHYERLRDQGVYLI